MHVGNAIGMLFEEGNGGNIVACDEVSEIDVRSVEFRQGERLLPMLGGGGGVAVISHPELVLVGKLSKAFEILVLAGDLGGNGPATQGFGEREDIIQLIACQ